MVLAKLASLKKPHSIHIAGIGGIGTSALAQWLVKLGFKVDGSDATASTITRWLEHHHIPIQIGEGTEIADTCALLIYSDALPSSHSLRQVAKRRSIPQHSYAEILGELTLKKTTVAIAGSHGKSTTTALIGLLLSELNLDPTVIVGTLVQEWQKLDLLGNFKPGRSDIAVVEADEYNRHFHYLQPSVAVVTSVDHDHIDAFPTTASYQQAFIEFIGRIQKNGWLIIEKSAHQISKDSLTVPTSHLIVYGQAEQKITDHLQHLIEFSQPQVVNGRQQFTVFYNRRSQGELQLGVPGSHMVANVTAALASALALNYTWPHLMSAARQVVANFSGTWRRLERLGEANGVLVFSDYAHHPTEVAALLAACQQFYNDRRLVLIFQPHQLQRAAAFSQQFIEVFKKHLRAHDKLLLAPVYRVPGREDNLQNVDLSAWAKAIGPNAQTLSSLGEIEAILKQYLQPGQIIVVAGAGDIDARARQAMAKLTQ